MRTVINQIRLEVSDRIEDKDLLKERETKLPDGVFELVVHMQVSKFSKKLNRKHLPSNNPSNS